jgi:hypothetical protein
MELCKRVRTPLNWAIAEPAQRAGAESGGSLEAGCHRIGHANAAPSPSRVTLVSRSLCSRYSHWAVLFRAPMCVAGSHEAATVITNDTTRMTDTPSVFLVVWHITSATEGEISVQLKIPLEDIERLTTSPLKWLHYVAWAITGLEGYLSNAAGEEGSRIVNTNAAVTSGQFFFYVTSAGESHAAAIIMQTPNA